MRKSILKKSIALALSAMVAASSFTGCGIFDKGKDEKTQVEKASEKNEELSFVDVMKAVQNIENGEMKGTVSITNEGQDKNFEYTGLVDGNGGAQFSISEVGSESKLADVVLYDNVLYITADMSMLLMGGPTGTGQTQTVSVDIKELSKTYGVDIDNILSSEVKNEYKSLLVQILETLAKDMPSVFGKDLILDSANADKTFEEFEVFAKNDMRSVLDSIKGFVSKYSLSGDEELYDSSKIEEIEKNGIEEKDKEEIMEFLKNTDAKVTADISGNDGSQVLNYTLYLMSKEDSNNQIKIDMDATFEEKTVDIKSLVPTDAINLDDYISSMFGSLSDDLVDGIE